MNYSRQDIAAMDRITRLKIVNGVSGIKSANLIGTRAGDQTTNLAVFNSVVHIGSNPPLLGFIARPQTKEVGHTLQNIKETGEYTINHIHPEFTKQAHYTSAKFERNTSEFERCGLTEEYLGECKAPFVKESRLKMAMRFMEAIPIELNGTTLVIGEIVNLILPDGAMADGDLDLEKVNGVGISGLNSYYELKKIAYYPYAEVTEVPEF